ncbi:MULTISPECIES: putative quinol monooxygenase [Providencia]|uniref:putative quinol monooxygenase n=1 Tax=Providencia TaxID=586 RepID=UPI001C5B8826|nr:MULTISPECIES: putative quinol monooxygenase [Providencia]QXX84807.1 antibiotic biosynthesis monooxygenase [Providencia sp. R33]
MSEIRIVATIIAKDNEVEFVKSATKSIVEPSNRDEGCLQYELHQDNANPNTFVFFEIWQDQQSLDKHNATQHLQDFIKKVEGKINLLDVKLISKIA